MIVHKGGEANPPKSFSEVLLNDGNDGLYDLRFSKKYPQFVQGEGYAAEVVITQDQLDRAVKFCVVLLRYAAGELRSRELAHAQFEIEQGVWDDKHKRSGFIKPQQRT